MKRAYTEGMTILEVTIAIGIFSFIILSFVAFQQDFFKLNRLTEEGLGREAEIRTILKNFSKEVRAASISSTGGYVIETAGTTTLTFFVDRDNNGVKERIRYFLSGTILKKGVLVPTGSPLVYNSANETVTDLVHDVTNTPVFTYFNANYTGTEAPLTQPINTPDVRLIRMTLVIDPNGSQPPSAQTYSTQGMIRGLRGF